MSDRRFRLFILGAGFSQAAGLPLGGELWREIRKEAGRSPSGFDRDLELYLTYLREAEGRTMVAEDVDFEDFLAFLDIEHRLGFKGSDTWSEDGNSTQILVKQSIGRVLCERTPPPHELPSVYYEFARQLQPGDYVLTFNYDRVLEHALEHVAKPYRLFPTRYSEVTSTGGTVDSSAPDEVVVLKLHGSIDWFDRSTYQELARIHANNGLSAPKSDPVFSPDAGVRTTPLLEGPHPEPDPLLAVFRVIEGLESVYTRPNSLGGVPFLLTPSRAKTIYLDQFKTFWWGIGKGGGYNLGVVIIGYSLPDHDAHSRQALFRLLRNYQDSWWREEMVPGRMKDKVILIDSRSSEAGQHFMRARFGFLDDAKTHYVWSGFDSGAVRMIEEGVLAE